MLRTAVCQNILGVNYTRLNLGEQGDLYLTDFGVPFADCLLPDNFLNDREWLKGHSQRLSGTSTVYRITTKTVKHRHKEIVMKWNRMGQDVPGCADDMSLAAAEFNSPFEEFALLMELRRSAREAHESVLTHKPLAIYVPREQVELWEVGRKDYLMQNIIEKHVDIELDMLRRYAVIYEWIKGIDAAEAFTRGFFDQERVAALMTSADKRLEKLGFQVVDRKPHHLIVRPCIEGGLLTDRCGEPVMALIDFELLTRTQGREDRVRRQRRHNYLKRQRDRFAVTQPPPLSHLHQVSIMDVDYVWGRAESTNGSLWVVGRDPELFDYFLPERWEKTPRTRLSAYNEIYHTLTKDQINLVWKVSKVGIQPDCDPFKEDEKRILNFGYNSPFEEVSLVMELTRHGLSTIYPRAIYMTGVKTEVRASLRDRQRFENHRPYTTPDGQPLLREDRDYILIWGFWNGPDEKLAIEDSNYYRGIDALRALREGLISQEQYVDLLRSVRERLLAVGIEDLNLRGSHLLLSALISTGHLITDSRGIPEVRISNFELLRRVASDVSK